MEIEKLIQEQIQNVEYENLVTDEIRRCLTGDIKRTINEVMRNEIEDIIKSEIEIVMSGEVFTDDGWGRKEKFNSFENLFKKTFKEKLNSSYDIKRILGENIKKRVSQLYEKNKADAIEKVVDAMTKTHIVKK